MSLVINDPTDFADALLAALNDPVTPDNVTDIVDWYDHEGGNWKNTAKYNPLNTTEQEQGSSSINSVGVQSYDSWQQGIAATVQTLTEDSGSVYPNILSALAAGDVPVSIFGNYPDLNTWGTGTFSGGSGAAVGSSGGTASSASTSDPIQGKSLDKALELLDRALNPGDYVGSSSTTILGFIKVPNLSQDLTVTILTIVDRAMFSLIFAGIGAAGLVLLIRRPVANIAGIVNPLVRTAQSSRRLDLAEAQESRRATTVPASQAKSYATLDADARAAYDSHRRTYG